MVRQRQTARRSTTWFDTRFNFDVATGSQATLRITPTGDDLEGFTIARIRATMIWYPSTPLAVSGVQEVSFGIGMASEEAFTAGSLPDPVTDIDYPERGWIVKDTALVVDELLSTGAGIPPPLRLVYDLRAQRKIDKGMAYWIANNAAIQGSTFNVRMFGLIRLLCLRP